MSTDATPAARSLALGHDTLRRRIVSLALSVLLPALLVAGLLLWTIEQQARRSLQDQLQNTARALSLVVDRQFDEQAALLNALAASAELRRGDFAAFDAVARRAAPPGPRWVVVHGQDEQQLVNTRAPWGAPLPRTPVTAASWAGERNGMRVTNLVAGPVAQAPVVGFSRMVTLDDGRKVRLGVTSLPGEFDRIFADQGLPARWTATLVDATQGVVARSRDSAKYIGRKASVDMRAAIARAPEGVVRTQTLDGIKTLSAYRRLPGYGWSVIVGVPRQELSVVAGQTLAYAAILAMALLGAGFMLAARAARSIEQPVHALGAAVRSWGRGARFEPPEGHAPEELRELAHHFGEASTALEEANAQLSDEVRARTRELDQIWRLSRDAFLVTNAEGMWLRASPAWTEILGWTEAELVGRTSEWIAHPEDRRGNLAQIERLRQGLVVSRFENRFRGRDGRYRWFSWSAVPFEGLNYCVIRDITAEKEAAEELERAQDALRQAQKMDAMGQLTGGVAHDFNNLLTPILGGLDMLRRRAALEERDARLLAAATESAERARTLVQRLLAFARRQPLQPRAVDIAELLQGVTTLVSSTLGPRIRVSLDVAPGLPAARADVNQLEMALLNLAVNARDAMPDGGAVTISAEAVAVEAGQVEGLRRGEYVRISVADTGQGMDEQTLARAIEPFFSTKGVGKGTGLGLSMVHGLAAQLGGALTLSSRPGMGANVGLWLPVAKGRRAAAPGLTAAESESEAAGVALLVDDENLVRLTTAEMLAAMGYSVVEAGGAKEALSLLAGGLRPAVVVTDHVMPEMTGAELAQALRRDYPGTPVLIVSGYAEVDTLPADLPRLRKPFVQSELAAEVVKLTRTEPAGS